ncbi:MAG: Yip1 family protein [Candidatus Binataceae bacterium]
MTDAIRPFLTIWVEPRATIRRIVDTDPRRNVIALAAIGGGLGVLASSWFVALANPGSTSAWWPIGVVLKAALGCLWGIVGLYSGGWLIGLACRVLGGVASYVEMRAALAWGNIAEIAATTLTIAIVLLGIVSPPEFKGGGIHWPTGAKIELAVLNGSLGIWGMVIQLKCLGEVNRFSAWRALGAILLMVVVLVAIVLLFVYFGGGFANHAKACFAARCWRAGRPRLSQAAAEVYRNYEGDTSARASRIGGCAPQTARGPSASVGMTKRWTGFCGIPTGGCRSGGIAAATRAEVRNPQTLSWRSCSKVLPPTGFLGKEPRNDTTFLRSLSDLSCEKPATQSMVARKRIRASIHGQGRPRHL